MQPSAPGGLAHFAVQYDKQEDTRSPARRWAGCRPDRRFRDRTPIATMMMTTAVATAETPKRRDRLVALDLDQSSLMRGSPEAEHEREVAVHDLLEENHFAPVGKEEGPYRLVLSMAEQRLIFDVRREDGKPVMVHILSLTPLRKIMKDYFMICDSYRTAIRTATPTQIEAIDMGRRGVHNDGSGILMERLDGKIEIDLETARRLFTLVCALHWKG